MKNTKETSVFKYAKALALMLVLSSALSFAFNAGDMLGFASMLPKVFCTLLATQILMGITGIYKRMPKGSLRNDSLVINDTSYAGTVAPYFVLPAMFSFDTVAKKAVYVKDGIKKQHTIPTMDFSGPLQPRVAQPNTSGGNVTIDKRVINPQDTMAYQLMNPRNFEVHWDAENLSQTLLTRQLPATAENYIMLLLMGRSFEQFELTCWQGSTQYQNNVNVPQFNPDGTPNAYYQIQWTDGFIKRFLNDSSVVAIGSPVTITSSNIGTILMSMYNSLATNNKGLLAMDADRTKMKFFVSYATEQLYEQYLTTQPFKGNDPTERGLKRFLNWEIVPLAGVPDNTIVFTWAESAPTGNLWVGMNSVSDENFMLARHRPDSELFFFKMLMKIDVNYGRSEKVFLYTTLTTNDFIK